MKTGFSMTLSRFVLAGMLAGGLLSGGAFAAQDAAAPLPSGTPAAAPAAASAAEADAPERKMGAVVSNEKSRAAQAFMESASTGAQGFSTQGLKENEASPAEFDPKTNPRLYEISTQLRCLVCANESIAESNVELAIDLRREVAKQIKAGKTDEQIIDFMVDRYGDYVLFKPPFKAKTYLLWFGPVAFFVLALWALMRIVSSRRAQRRDRRAHAAEADIERAKAILRGELVFSEGAFVEASAARRAKA